MLINLGLHALVWAVLLSPQSLPIHLALVGRKPSKVINKYYFIIGTAISFCLEKHNNYVSCNISADLFEVMILGLLNIRPKEILSTPSKCQTFNVLVYHTNIFFFLEKQLLWFIAPKTMEYYKLKCSELLCTKNPHGIFVSSDNCLWTHDTHFPKLCQLI